MPSRRVIVTRPAREAARWVEALQHSGIDAVALPLQLRHADMAMGVSIGIVLTDGGATPEDLLAAADKAMYQAKQNGRGSYVLAPTVR